MEQGALAAGAASGQRTVEAYRPKRAGVLLGVMGASSFLPGVTIFTALEGGRDRGRERWRERGWGGGREREGKISQDTEEGDVSLCMIYYFLYAKC